MEELIKYGVYALLAVSGWFLRVLWDAQKEMRNDLKKIELDIATNYTRRSDFKEVISEMKDEFKEITKPLYSKLDRIEEYILTNISRNKNEQ